LDVHLAALPIEYGLTLCSTDADFARVIDLKSGSTCWPERRRRRRQRQH
jgi:hypothetical protein